MLSGCSLPGWFLALLPPVLKETVEPWQGQVLGLQYLACFSPWPDASHCSPGQELELQNCPEVRISLCEGVRGTYPIDGWTSLKGLQGLPSSMVTAQKIFERIHMEFD